jgi:isocitrate/isopropylmalate dehydrogenase
MGRTVCVIPGDGIGPEVTTATLKALDAAGGTGGTREFAEAVVERL